MESIDKLTDKYLKQIKINYADFESCNAINMAYLIISVPQKMFKDYQQINNFKELKKERILREFLDKTDLLKKLKNENLYDLGANKNFYSVLNHLETSSYQIVSGSSIEDSEQIVLHILETSKINTT